MDLIPALPFPLAGRPDFWLRLGCGLHSLGNVAHWASELITPISLHGLAEPSRWFFREACASQVPGAKGSIPKIRSTEAPRFRLSCYCFVSFGSFSCGGEQGDTGSSWFVKEGTRCGAFCRVVLAEALFNEASCCANCPQERMLNVNLACGHTEAPFVCFCFEQQTASQRKVVHVPVSGSFRKHNPRH